MTSKTGVIRLRRDGKGEQNMSRWTAMPLMGDIIDGAPKERFRRVFDTIIQSPIEVRAGVWQATRYSERLADYPYNEIVFLLEALTTTVRRNFLSRVIASFSKRASAESGNSMRPSRSST